MNLYIYFLDGECYEVANYPNNDITSFSITSEIDNPIKECQFKCQEEENCVGFSLESDQKCHLKNEMESKISQCYVPRKIIQIIK